VRACTACQGGAGAVAGRSSTMSPLNIGAGDGYEDDIFEEVGAQLTIEEIVNQRFEEAGKGVDKSLRFYMIY
jgi:hypothetical protein